MSAALLLFAIYALPLFWPPAPVPPGELGAEAHLWARLFPGVPGEWVAVRLLALAGAVGLAFRRVRMPRLANVDTAHDSRPVRTRARVTAWVLALAALALSFAVSHFGGALDVAYMLALGAPCIALALGTPRSRSEEPPLTSGRFLACAVLVVVWAVWRGFELWHSARVADVVDTWLGFAELVRVAYHGGSVLGPSGIPGVPGAYLFFQGAALFEADGIPARVELVQLFHVFWLASSALGVAWLVGRWVGADAAPVATAAFLFSPFVLFAAIAPTPNFLGPLFSVGLLVALTGVVRGAPAGSAGLAALAGLGITMPPLLPTVVLAGLAWVLLCIRGGVSREVIALSGVVFVAGLLPGLPAWVELGGLAELHIARAGTWSGLEWMVMGHTSPFEAESLWIAGGGSLLDIPLGSLLSPVAIPRTPLRLWGDALFDPLGTGLAVLGLALCSAALVRRAPIPWVLVALLGAAFAPGLLSSFDRPSHTRMFVMPIPLALLAAVGFASLRGWGRLLSRPGASVCVALLIAIGGSLLFDVVNPRILAQSALGISLRALEGPRPENGVALLDYSDEERFPWLHIRSIARFVPREPLPVISWEGVESVGRVDVVAWSPALEADRQISRDLCGRWPAATFFELTDRAGLGRAHAARLAAGAWTPELPARQWREYGCGDVE